MRREAFQQQLAREVPEKTVFLDETGVVHQTYPYGWGKRGQPIYAKRKGKRSERISIVAALLNGVVFAQQAFTGMCNRIVFMGWLKNVLLPKLPAGMTLVMDNARFHHAQEITALVEKHGCRILYLPPYSPDFNPIEQAWAPLKNKIRKYLRQDAMSLTDAVNLSIL